MNSDYYNYKRIKGEWSKFRKNNWFKWMMIHVEYTIQIVKSSSKQQC